MTRKVVARALPVLVGTVVILAAVVRGIVAPISGAGVLVTIIAALFGTGALLMARRDKRTVDEGPPMPAGPDPSEVDTPLVESAIADRSAGPWINLDLRPGHESLTMLDDRGAETATEPSSARDPSWLDHIIATDRRGAPTLDVRGDAPAIELPTDQRLPTERPRADTSEPRVLASLPVRETKFADDPQGEPDNGTRQSPLAEPDPIGRPTAAANADAATVEHDLATPGTATLIRRPTAAGDELFAGAPSTEVNNGDLAPGGLFSRSSRAWRPGHNRAEGRRRS